MPSSCALVLPECTLEAPSKRRRHPGTNQEAARTHEVWAHSSKQASKQAHKQAGLRPVYPECILTGSRTSLECFLCAPPGCPLVAWAPPRCFLVAYWIRLGCLLVAPWCVPSAPWRHPASARGTQERTRKQPERTKHEGTQQASKQASMIASGVSRVHPRWIPDISGMLPTCTPGLSPGCLDTS